MKMYIKKKKWFIIWSGLLVKSGFHSNSASYSDKSEIQNSERQKFHKELHVNLIHLLQYKMNYM